MCPLFLLHTLLLNLVPPFILLSPRHLSCSWMPKFTRGSVLPEGLGQLWLSCPVLLLPQAPQFEEVPATALSFYHDLYLLTRLQLISLGGLSAATELSLLLLVHIYKSRIFALGFLEQIVITFFLRQRKHFFHRCCVFEQPKHWHFRYFALSTPLLGMFHFQDPQILITIPQSN